MNRFSPISGGADKVLRHGRFAIPAGEPKLLGFYLDELFVPHSRPELAFAPLARRMPRLASTGLARETAELWADQPMLADLLQTAGIAVGSPLKRICLRDYASSGRGKTISFLFESEGVRPIAVAKSSNVPEQQVRLAHEQEALRTLSEILPSALRQTIPAPLGETRKGTVVQFVETFAGGRFLYRDLRASLRPRGLIGRHFQLAGDWLLLFQQATSTNEVVLDEATISEHLLQPFRTLERQGRASALAGAYGHMLANRARLFAGTRLPLVARHGDFWPRNILVDGAQVRVIDWEGYTAACLPFHDWFHFALSYGLSFPWRLGRWEQPETALRKTFAPGGPLRSVIGRGLIRAAKQLGVPPALACLFLPVTLAERALASPHDRRWPHLLEVCAREPGLVAGLVDA